MKSRQKTVLCFIISMAFLFSGCATVQDVFHIRSGGVAVKTDDGYMQVVFSDRDKSRIRNYYYASKRRHKGLPPGLAKKDKLPPGLQKRIDAGAPLPPGLRGRGLPDELEGILSPLPKGYIRLKVGGDVVIMDQKTRVVVDMVRDIE